MRTVRLCEVADLTVGYVGTMAKHYVKKGVPFIRSLNVEPFKITQNDLKYISPEFNDKLSKSKLHRGDVVIVRTGKPGACAVIPEEYEEINCSDLVIVRPYPGKLDPLFLACYINYSYRTVNAQLVGAVQQHFNVRVAGNLEINLPPISKQKQIAKIIRCLNEKIQVNEAINKNLAQQAQAIYADIFITNADSSRPLGHLSDLITVRYGKDHKKLDDGPFPVYGSGGVMRYVDRPIYEKESVLIPRKGTLNNVMYVNEPFWSVDTMFFTEMKLPDVAKFVFHFVKSKDLASLNAGSAVPSMTTDILNAMELCIPDSETLKRFESIVGPMYRAMQHNTVESKKLAAVRETLLPRLMSGELDVSNLDL